MGCTAGGRHRAGRELGSEVERLTLHCMLDLQSYRAWSEAWPGGLEQPWEGRLLGWPWWEAAGVDQGRTRPRLLPGRRWDGLRDIPEAQSSDSVTNWVEGGKSTTLNTLTRCHPPRRKCISQGPSPAGAMLVFQQRECNPGDWLQWWYKN